MKSFMLALVILFLGGLDAASAADELWLKAFVPTHFGVKSRTLDKSEAEAVIKKVQEARASHPGKKLLRIELLTCTADYPLPQSTLVKKDPEEHLTRARERHEMVLSEVQKVFAVTVMGEARVCGPAFQKLDLNSRFVTPMSGNIFEQQMGELLKSKDFLDKLKQEALVENPDKLKIEAKSVFLAKYRPFQGIRVIVWGEASQALGPKTLNSGSSGKSR